jgi:cbb3-type cytochrome oxidase maturation protein
MNALVFLIPAALLLGGFGLAAFLWSVRNGQFDDLDGAAQRILVNDDQPPDESETRSER